ncbi:unnamed protein product [Allacma fusca]|uniref:Uncharacterized protein n=1 Tax=Allacma fusca TaxID=39272 RepID=A0A8J2PWT2_9HEXA|nr:unnamed protein product [Allacma fusca]
MIDEKILKPLIFALKVESKLRAIPFNSLPDNIFNITSRSLNLFILSTICMGINLISAAVTTVEDVFGSEKVQSNTILRLFGLCTFVFVFTTQLNLLIHRQEFLTLVNQYSSWQSQFGHRSESWKSLDENNNSELYVKFFIPYQFNTPVIFGLLFLHSPEKLPSSYDVVLRILGKSPVFGLSQILPYLWVFVVMYEWALVMGIVHFYMFNIIVYCKEAIITLKTISANLENRNVFIVQDNLKYAQFFDSVNIPMPHLLASLDGCPRSDSFVMHLRKCDVPLEASCNISGNVHNNGSFLDWNRNTPQLLGGLGL